MDPRGHPARVPERPSDQHSGQVVLPAMQRGRRTGGQVHITVPDLPPARWDLQDGKQAAAGLSSLRSRHPRSGWIRAGWPRGERP